MSNADNPGDAGSQVGAQRTCSCAVTGAAAGKSAGGRLAKVLSHFDCMVDHCLEYVDSAKAQGRPLVGIMCEFTPREIILAAGGVPVCLCGGSADTIPAAERQLPLNLCPLIKSTFGYHVSGSNPFLKQADLVVAETTCDGKKKMFEVMAESKPMYVLDLPQTADAPEVEEAWIRELRDFQHFLEERFGTEITDEKLWAAIRLMNRERGLRRRLADCMIQDPPPITGRQLLDMKSIISGMESDLEQYEAALRALAEDERSGGDTKAIRVLLTGVPVVHGAERVVDVIEGRGCVVVAMENCTGLKPILEDVDESAPDPIVAIARKYLHLPCSVMMRNESRINTLRALAAKFRPHCVIELVWQACLTYDVESYFVRKLVEEELRLPYLKITTDYSPSDSARIAARVDALSETVLAHC